MDSIASRHPQFTANPRHLSGLYSRGKSASPPTSADDSPEILSLHRKYRIQRDRLIAWGLEWNDGENQQVNIDDSLERAGLTEVVLSVMENIKLMLDEVDNIRIETVTGTYPHEKETTKRPKTGPWTNQEKEQYQDLIKDFTTSIDLLCDLKARRQPLGFPTSNKSETDVEYFDRKTPSLLLASSKTDVSLINRSAPIFRPSKHDYIPLIDYSSLNLLKESPPSYDETGPPRPSRDFADLRLSLESDKDKDGTQVISVLVEYVHLDRNSQNDNMTLLVNRLQELFIHLKTIASSNPQPILPTLLGYFEDPHHPRIGLVFDLSSRERNVRSLTRQPYYNLSPVSLLDKLQNASQLQANPLTSSATSIPPLEERFILANQLVCGLSALDNDGFTHQALTSHSIVLLPRLSLQPQSRKIASQHEILEPLLGGFDLQQPLSGQAPPLTSQAIYHHPADPKVTGTTSAHDSRPLYNLYSLGLILLEIGLWTPISDIFKKKYTLQDFRTRVEKIWIPRLAGKCGTAYMEAVRDCLDADIHTKGTPEMLQQTWSRVKVRLARCCLLAEPEQEESDKLSMVHLRTTADTHSPEVRRVVSSTAISVSRPIPAAPPSPSVETRPTSNTMRKLTAPRQPRPTAPQMFLDLPIPQQALNHWENILVYRVGKVVDKELNKLPGKPSTCSISLDMCGETRDVAKPTILVSVSRDWDLVEAKLRKSFAPEQLIYDFGVFYGPIVRAKSGAERTAGRDIRPARNAFYQEKPVCGASIGAWVNHEHSPPVTFGGVVMVDDQVYGLTVHHMLEMPDTESDDDDILGQGSGAEEGAESGEDEDEDEDEVEVAADGDAKVTPRFTRSSCSQPRHYKALPTLPNCGQDSPSVPPVDSGNLEGDSDGLSDHSNSASVSDDDDDDEELELIGDTAGVVPSTGPRIIVTQPALLDVPPDFFPVPDDKDEDHLDSHSLGHVYASSGLRRANHTINSITAKVEIDWALIKLNPRRLQPANVVVGGKTHCRHAADAAYQPRLHDPVFRNKHRAAEDVYPRFVTSSVALTGLSVHSIGRTTGLTAGVVRSLGLVRFPNRRTSSRVWVVRGGMGVPGDSGAWIIDNASGQVCGHILAWSEMAGAAFMAPMDLTLEDVKRTLGAETVRLPGALPWEGVGGSSSVTSGDGSAHASSTSVNTLNSALEKVQIAPKPVSSTWLNEGLSLSTVGIDQATGSRVRHRIASINASAQARSTNTAASSVYPKKVCPKMVDRPMVMRDRRIDGERMAMTRVADCFD